MQDGRVPAETSEGLGFVEGDALGDQDIVAPPDQVRQSGCLSCLPPVRFTAWMARCGWRTILSARFPPSLPVTACSSRRMWTAQRAGAVPGMPEYGFQQSCADPPRQHLMFRATPIRGLRTGFAEPDLRPTKCECERGVACFRSCRVAPSPPG